MHKMSYSSAEKECEGRVEFYFFEVDQESKEIR